MKKHRYILQPYKGTNTRYRCPICNKREKTFTRYIDNQTGEYLHSTVGICGRIKCKYHYTPRQYFQDNGNIVNYPQQLPYINPQARKKVSFINPDVFKASLKRYEANNFIIYLINHFGIDLTNEVINKYCIGTSKHWQGASVFWQIDRRGNVRTGKIMLYSYATGKRVKKPFNHITWVHSVVSKEPEFGLQQCFFGEHLLTDKTKHIALCESEKTAVIGSIYFPQLIWLAAGSLNNINAEKCYSLIGWTVILFPDLNGFEKWSEKAKELSHITKFIVSDILHSHATGDEKIEGLDLADYLLKYDYKKFTQHQPAYLPNKVINNNINLKSKITDETSTKNQN